MNLCDECLTELEKQREIIAVFLVLRRAIYTVIRPQLKKKN